MLQQGLIDKSEVKNVIPEGFGSNIKLNVVNGVAVGIERDISPNDKPFINNYLNYLVKDFKRIEEE